MTPRFPVVAAAAAIALLRSATAHASLVGLWADEDMELRPQLQLDGGLSILGLAFEYPITGPYAVAVGGGVMSTYFAPWFDAGDRVDGFCGEVRITRFTRTDGRGLYVAPFLRVGRVTGERDDAEGDGWGLSTGAFVGWTFGLGERFDLRVGGGFQYFHYVVETAAGDVDVTTPFVAIDAVLGFRL
jgi:hypothetical protein